MNHDSEGRFLEFREIGRIHGATFRRTKNLLSFKSAVRSGLNLRQNTDPCIFPNLLIQNKSFSRTLVALKY